MEEFKEMQRAVWSAGDYAPLSERISQVGELVVERAGVEPGIRVLDVACGTGNAAIPAARAGAEVTGLDLAPKLLQEGREKAAREGSRSSGSRPTPRSFPTTTECSTVSSRRSGTCSLRATSAWRTR